MRQSEVEPVLDALFLGLGERFAQISFEAHFAVSTFVAAHREMTELAAVFHDRPPLAGTGHRFRQMWTAIPAMDVRQWPPVYIAIGGRQAQDEEFIAILINNLNEQHLWLLVQAFETIERYYKDFYGALGYLDENLWKCSDFGDVRIQDISSFDLAWFQEQVRRTIGKHNVNGVLNNLRRSFPAFATAETRHELDLALWFDIAAFFRHLIVHSRASISQQDLIPSLTKATGHSFTGDAHDVQLRLCSAVSHFERRTDMYFLWLIDRNRIQPSCHSLNDRFDRLLSKLASHASLTYATAMQYFRLQPFWERTTIASTLPPVQ